VPADGHAALFWFRRAADHGMTEAFVAVAELYLGQGGIPADPTAASEWLLRAADLGSGEAMYLIGLRYAEGQEEARDEVEALKWFELALTRAIGALRDNVARRQSTNGLEHVSTTCYTGLVFKDSSPPSLWT